MSKGHQAASHNCIKMKLLKPLDTEEEYKCVQRNFEKVVLTGGRGRRDMDGLFMFSLFLADSKSFLYCGLDEVQFKIVHSSEYMSWLSFS